MFREYQPWFSYGIKQGSSETILKQYFNPQENRQVWKWGVLDLIKKTENGFYICACVCILLINKNRVDQPELGVGKC
jgi:hypothetical protein